MGRAGKRRIIPIVGGSVEGERIGGEILDLGADWQSLDADGLAELDTRHALKTRDGAIIETVNQGLRHGPAEVMARVGEDVDPANCYMRTDCRLETGDPRYTWVNRALFLGTGGRRAASDSSTERHADLMQRQGGGNAADAATGGQDMRFGLRLPPDRSEVAYGERSTRRQPVRRPMQPNQARMQQNPAGN